MACNQEDVVSLFPEGELDTFDNIDPTELRNVMEEEAAELREMEKQVKLLKHEEEQKKRKAIMEGLEHLQQIKAKKAMYRKMLAGEMPAAVISTSVPSTAQNQMMLGRQVGSSSLPSSQLGTEVWKKN